MLPSYKLAQDRFGEEANFYAPYYRQITLESWAKDLGIIKQRLAIAMDDLQAAFQYYLQHENQGRPFILAGFSQGGEGVKHLLKGMSASVYERMIAAYVIGFTITQGELDKYPYLVAAKDSSDVGVTICYNSASDYAFLPSFIRNNAVCINPVNWTTSETKAKLNDTVSVWMDTNSNFLYVEGFNPDNYFVPSLEYLFTRGSYHLQELTFYQEYLKANAKVRFTTFKNKLSPNYTL